MNKVLQKLEELSQEIDRAGPGDGAGNLRKALEGFAGEVRDLLEQHGASVVEPSAVERMQENARRIGHDMNNCLGIVGGRAELLVMHLDRENLEGARKGVDIILGQMDRMKELSGSLRDLLAIDNSTHTE